MLFATSSAVISGPGSGSAPALGRVSAQRYGHARVPGLPLLPRHGALHPADRRPGAAAVGPHGHGPAVSAARLLVSTRAPSTHVPILKIALGSVSLTVSGGSFAGTLTTAGCCGSSPTCPPPITAKVRVRCPLLPSSDETLARCNDIYIFLFTSLVSHHLKKKKNS